MTKSSQCYALHTISSFDELLCLPIWISLKAIKNPCVNSVRYGSYFYSFHCLSHSVVSDTHFFITFITLNEAYTGNSRAHIPKLQPKYISKYTYFVIVGAFDDYMIFLIWLLLPFSPSSFVHNSVDTSIVFSMQFNHSTLHI